MDAECARQQINDQHDRNEKSVCTGWTDALISAHISPRVPVQRLEKRTEPGLFLLLGVQPEYDAWQNERVSF